LDPTNVGFDYGKATINYYTSGTAYDVGYGSGTVIANSGFTGGQHVLWTAGAKAFQIQNAYAPLFQNLDINLRANGQTGFEITGSSPSAPYYGVVDNVRIFGNGTIGGGQYGYRLFPTGTSGSDGVNRWIFSNLRHIAAVDYGVDIIGADGLVFTNVNFEACYNTAARFNEVAPYHNGTVTTGGVAGQIVDSTFINNGDTNSASVIVHTGPNAGRSKNVSVTAAGNIVFYENFPNNFAVGDSYSLYLNKARNISFLNCTCETAGIVADFSAGARECKMQFAQCTVSNTSSIFERAIEDMGNTVAREYVKFTFAGKVTAGGGTFWLEPEFSSPTKGGVCVHTGPAWIDCVSITGAIRAAGQAGDIDVVPIVNGVSEGAAMTATLTPVSPNYDFRVKKSLTPLQYIRPGQNIQLRAIATSALAVDEYVRAEVYVGVL